MFLLSWSAFARPSSQLVWTESRHENLLLLIFYRGLAPLPQALCDLGCPSRRWLCPSPVRMGPGPDGRKVAGRLCGGRMQGGPDRRRVRATAPRLLACLLPAVSEVMKGQKWWLLGGLLMCKASIVPRSLGCIAFCCITLDKLCGAGHNGPGVVQLIFLYIFRIT
jgi:hypothetical protein